MSDSAKRRAVVFAEYFPPYMSSDRRLFHLIEDLKRWDCDVVVTPPLRCMTGLCEDALKGYAENFRPPAKPLRLGNLHGSYLVVPNMLYRLFPKNIFLLPIAYALTIPILTIEAIRILKARNPELAVIGHPSFITGVVATLAARFCRVPLLLDYPTRGRRCAETAGAKHGGFLEHVLRHRGCCTERGRSCRSQFIRLSAPRRDGADPRLQRRRRRALRHPSRRPGAAVRRTTSCIPVGGVGGITRPMRSSARRASAIAPSSSSSARRRGKAIREPGTVILTAGSSIL